MADKKYPPQRISSQRKFRMQTQTERDVEGLAAKREREKERESVPVEYDQDEITGRLQGEDLSLARERRPLDERIGRLEQKHDQLATEVSGVRIEVAKVAGKLEVLPELVNAVKGVAERAAEREHIKLTAQVDIDKANAADAIDGRRIRRQTIAKIVAGVFGGITLVELLRFFLMERR